MAVFVVVLLESVDVDIEAAPGRLCRLAHLARRREMATVEAPGEGVAQAVGAEGVLRGFARGDERRRL
jgi:hypothetical protein